MYGTIFRTSSSLGIALCPPTSSLCSRLSMVMSMMLTVGIVMGSELMLSICVVGNSSSVVIMVVGMVGRWWRRRSCLGGSVLLHLQLEANLVVGGHFLVALLFFRRQSTPALAKNFAELNKLDTWVLLEYLGAHFVREKHICCAKVKSQFVSKLQ
jgi:hypothetical protein